MIHRERPPPWEHRKHENAAASMLQFRDSGSCFSTSRHQLLPGSRRQNTSDIETVQSSVSNGTGSNVERKGSPHHSRSPCRESLESIQLAPVTGPRSFAVPVSTVYYAASDEKERTSCDASASAGASGMPQKGSGEHSFGSIGWKPTKWSRPNGLLVKESGVTSGAETLITSPNSVDRDEATVRKKPRLGWGQGLAQYEKQKGQGQVDSPVSGSSGVFSSGDRSPTVRGAVSCPPSSALVTRASTEQATLEEDQCTTLSCGNVVDISHEVSVSDWRFEEFIGKLHDLNVYSLSSVTSVLSDILHPDDACSGDSSTRQYTLDKLSLLKMEISKELEKTESEIDSLEGELKSLVSCFQIAGSCYSMINEGSSNVSNVPCGDALEVHKKKENDVISSQLDLEGVEPPIQTVKDNSRADLQPDRVEAVSSAYAGEEILKLESSGCQVEVTSSENQTTGSKYFLESALQLCTSESEGSQCCGSGVNNVKEASHAGVIGSLSSYSNAGNDIVLSIIASNQDLARRSSEVLEKAVMCNPSVDDLWNPKILLGHKKWDLRVREKICVHKNVLKFKKQALTMKSMALFKWSKIGQQLISVKRSHKKSTKRNDVNKCASGGICAAVPPEVLEFVSKLLLDCQLKPCRPNLKMPSLIIDDKERNASMFPNKNGLIENPVSFEHEKAMVNPWTPEEKRIFLEMLGTYGKNFARIASHLNHKSAADCVEFYYKNHKSDSFKEVMDRLGVKKHSNKNQPSCTYLVTTRSKHSRESNAADLDLMCTDSAVASHSFGGDRLNDKEQTLEDSVAADILAGICCSVSSETKSSCITTLEQHGRSFEMDGKVFRDLDLGSLSDEDCSELLPVDWTDVEKSKFVEALHELGKDFSKISNNIGTKSIEQCKVFFSKARRCLGLDVLNERNSETVVNNFETLEGSYTGDTSAPDIDSAVSSKLRCSRIVEVSQLTRDESDNAIFNGDSTVLSAVDATSLMDSAREIKIEETGSNPERPETILDSDGSRGCRKNNFQTRDGCKECINDLSSHNEPIYVVQDTTESDRNIRVDSVARALVPENIAAPSGYSDYISFPVVSIQQNAICGNLPTEMAKGKSGSSQVVSATRLKSCGKTNTEFSSNVISFSHKNSSESNYLQKGTMTTILPHPGSNPTYQHQGPLPTMLNQKLGMPSRQVDQQFVVKLGDPDPTSISFGASSCTTLENTAILNFKEHADRLPQKSGRELYQQAQQQILPSPVVNPVYLPMQILKGFPLQVSKHETEKKTDAKSERPLSSGTSLAKNGFPALSNQLMSQALPNPGLSVSCKTGVSAEMRSCPWSMSPKTESQASQVSKVKLFGKIISAPQIKEDTGATSHCGSKFPSMPIGTSNIAAPSNNENERRIHSSLLTSSSAGLQCGTNVMLDSSSRLKSGATSICGPPIMPARFRKALSRGYQYGKDPPPGGNSIITDYQPFSLLQNVNSKPTAAESNQMGGGAQFGTLLQSGSAHIDTGVMDPVVALKYASDAELVSTASEMWRRAVGGR